MAAENVPGANGITRDKEGNIYVASITTGQVYVLESQEDHSLVLTDVISLSASGCNTTFGAQELITCIDLPTDNLSLDSEDAVWAACKSLLQISLGCG